MNIHLDFETRSKANLKKEGMFRYSEDSSTLVLCAAYCIDDSAIQLWRPGQPIPSELRNAIENRAVVYAHNAGFELLIWNNVLRRDYPKLPRLNIDQMRDTAAMAAAMGLPRSLEHASLALKLKTQKEISGKSLIKQLCQLQ
ncbi:MAG: DNA polymerase, partial [Gammaproteobacteria bacterium]